MWLAVELPAQPARRPFLDCAYVSVLSGVCVQVQRVAGGEPEGGHHGRSCHGAGLGRSHGPEPSEGGRCACVPVQTLARYLPAVWVRLSKVQAFSSNAAKTEFKKVWTRQSRRPASPV